PGDRAVHHQGAHGFFLPLFLLSPDSGTLAASASVRSTTEARVSHPRRTPPGSSPRKHALAEAGRGPRLSPLRTRRLFFESPSRSRLLLEHDLFRKPASTFRDHALTSHSTGQSGIRPL